jgi:hypothetical protein
MLKANGKMLMGNVHNNIESWKKLMVLKFDGLQKHLGIARPLLLNWGVIIGWNHITMVKDCCHKYYSLKLHVFEPPQKYKMY